MTHLDRRALVLNCLLILPPLWAGFTMVGITIFVGLLAIGLPVGSTVSPPLFRVAFAAISFPALLLSAYISITYWQAYSYGIVGEFFVMEEHLPPLRARRRHIFLASIQAISVLQHPIARLFGLAVVVVQTAAPLGSVSVGPLTLADATALVEEIHSRQWTSKELVDPLY